MPTKSAFSVVGLAHKLFLAAEAEGYTPEMLNALAESPSLLAGMRSVQLGLANIKPILHAIDCDSPVFIPDGWSVLPDEDDDPNKCQLPNRVKGVFTWDPTSAKLYLPKKQQGDKRIVGNDLRKELKSQPVLPANILDYLLANPHLIPEEYKGKAIFFWGTIYRSSDGHLCVRYLYWHGGRWLWSFSWLAHDFSGIGPALVRAS